MAQLKPIKIWEHGGILPSLWSQRLDVVEYAMQPIVNINSGVCFGYEALLRNFEAAGYDYIPDFFDEAYEEGVLPLVDFELRKKAIEAFRELPWHQENNLFYNTDTRLWESLLKGMPSEQNFFRQLDFPVDSFCFEISERFTQDPAMVPKEDWDLLKQTGFKVAVDDCGVGFSGLKLIYYSEPHFVKIDRFFISDLADQPKKRLFVANLVNIAHRMGSIVVAEGVETEKEVYYCREIGCDLLQGFFVDYPQVDSGRLKRQYDHIFQITKRDRRQTAQGDRRIVQEQIAHLEPVFMDNEPLDVLMRFRASGDQRALPVVNRKMEPMGIILEESIKPFVYSKYGRSLLENPTLKNNLQKFVTKCPIADLRTPVDDILELYVQDESVRGVIIVDQLKYEGFLDARAILRALNERNLAQARDQNPLTKLPGNPMINSFLSHAANDLASRYTLVMLDFDNFKPFNDNYGFRNGDRVILLFAEILRAMQNQFDHFIGHIGGDDFFVGFTGWHLEQAISQVRKLQRKFATDVQSFYDPDDRRQGCICSEDRDGVRRCFPLLTVSAIVLELHPGRRRIHNLGEIGKALAEGKKRAKNSPERLSMVTI